MKKQRISNVCKNNKYIFYNTKTKRGITLISLVITIIILLILAAITLLSLTGENGLFRRGKQAKDDTAIAQEKECISLARMNLLSEFK